MLDQTDLLKGGNKEKPVMGLSDLVRPSPLLSVAPPPEVDNTTSDFFEVTLAQKKFFKTLN